jgi:hypothetical protein
MRSIVHATLPLLFCLRKVMLAAYVATQLRHGQKIQVSNL